MSDDKAAMPALEFLLAEAEGRAGYDDGGPDHSCWHCPFVAGPAVRSYAQTPLDFEPSENISNDFTEANYWCHLPTRLRDGKPVALDDPWRNQWGEYAKCTNGEWAAQARSELAQRAPAASTPVTEWEPVGPDSYAPGWFETGAVTADAFRPDPLGVLQGEIAELRDQMADLRAELELRTDKP